MHKKPCQSGKINLFIYESSVDSFLSKSSIKLCYMNSYYIYVFCFKDVFLHIMVHFVQEHVHQTVMDHVILKQETAYQVVQKGGLVKNVNRVKKFSIFLYIIYTYFVVILHTKLKLQRRDTWLYGYLKDITGKTTIFCFTVFLKLQ